MATKKAKKTPLELKKQKMIKGRKKVQANMAKRYGRK
jgi:hypothetical protein